MMATGAAICEHIGLELNVWRNVHKLRQSALRPLLLFEPLPRFAWARSDPATDLTFMGVLFLLSNLLAFEASFFDVVISQAFSCLTIQSIDQPVNCTR